MNYRKQKNLTISKEQKEFIEANVGKMTIGKISSMLGLTYNVCHSNLRVMGYVKPRRATVVRMKGYFDIDHFQKLYYNY